MSTHRIWQAACTLPIVLAFSLATFAATDRVRVYVVYKEGQHSNAARALAAAGAEVHYNFVGLRGYSISLPAVALEGLTRNPAIEYVEEDPKRYPMAQQTPYGIIMVQANQVSDSAAGGSTVCIIDSGIDQNHEDLAGNLLNGHSDPGGAGNWYTDENHHGTHVAGTIAALNNALGVAGVTPNGYLNVFIVKVFDAEGWAYSSTLVDALNRCVAGKTTGSNLIVSMSLGGSLKSRFEETAFGDAYASKNVLSVAAAGNDGNSRYSYPASYSSVISVAAIDVNQVRASFSQYNKQVELAAPGVGVLSTVLMGTGTTATVSVNGLAPEADAMEGSSLATASGALVNCGTGEASCAGAAGKVCLIQRGTNTFAEKVLNCQTGGGVAAVIYNNVDGALLGTLGGVATSIPSVGISKADGETLVAQQLGQTATVSVAASNYAKFDGTSMATPHVSAVAALVWSYYPTCTNAQVRNVLDATAKDLGAAGRDVYYGYGLVQAKAAYDRLAAGDCRGPIAGGKGKP